MYLIVEYGTTTGRDCGNDIVDTEPAGNATELWAAMCEIIGGSSNNT